uniref:Uncharacterized protein n=2 Tax=Setaria TaxID=4554 RepID=K4AHE1_SETIT|nr:hypothetical protein SEVIR_9G535700v2 [Setaria viridis]
MPTEAASTTPSDLLPLRQATAARTPTTLLAMTLPSSSTTRLPAGVISYFYTKLHLPEVAFIHFVLGTATDDVEYELVAVEQA